MRACCSGASKWDKLGAYGPLVGPTRTIQKRHHGRSTNSPYPKEEANGSQEKDGAGNVCVLAIPVVHTWRDFVFWITHGEEKYENELEFPNFPVRKFHRSEKYWQMAEDF
jgi:hypothetical protein